MTRTTDKLVKDLRYRAYFWLMDATMVVALLGVAEVIAFFVTGVRGFGLTGASEYAASLFVAIFSWIVPFVLMIARFMRDDYAEGLWKRTVVVLAYAVALFPIGSALVAWTAELGLPHDGQAYALWRTFYGPFTTEALRGDVIVSTVWQTYMWLFVFVFQILRWKDSR